MKNNSLDMTKGSVLRTVVIFALPLLFGNLFQQFYNVADTAIAGKLLGDDALSAIGSTSSLYSFLLYFVNGLNGGFCLVMARIFGEKNAEKLKKSIAISIIYNVLVSLIVIIIAFTLVKPFLMLLNTPKEIFNDAYSYIIVIFFGTPITAFYNIEANLLRAMGNSKTPIVYLIISSILNIILDIIFIKYFSMGVMGASFATVVSSGVSAVLCFIHIKRNYKELKLSKVDFKFERFIYKDMFTSGVAMALMNCIFAVGSLILQGAINGLGKAIIAGHLAARKIAEMFMQPLITIGSSASTFVSQNYGAKETSRIKKGIKYSVILSLFIALFSLILVYLFTVPMINIVTNTKNEVIINTAKQYLRINLPFYFSLGILYILRMSIQSLGNKVAPLLSSGIELLTKCFVAWFIIGPLGYFAVCIAEPISWVLGMVLLIFSFIKAYKRIDSLKKHEA